MSILIVTYDLNKERNTAGYEGVLSVIKGGGNWAKLSESCYAMDTSLSPQTIYEKVKPFLDAGDCLMVVTATSPYFGQHRPKVIDWLSGKM